MNSFNSVLIELNSQSIIQLVKALDLLKENNISFKLIEETKKVPTVKEKPLSKKLGRNGETVLHLLSEGYSYEDIAKNVDISINGVRFYVKKIYKALGVNNGRDAVRVYLNMKNTVPAQVR